MNSNTKNIIIRRISNSFLIPEERKRQFLDFAQHWTPDQCERIGKALGYEPQLLVEIVEHCVERAKEDGDIDLLKKIGDIILHAVKEMGIAQEQYETKKEDEDLSHFFDTA